MKQAMTWLIGRLPERLGASLSFLPRARYAAEASRGATDKPVPPVLDVVVSSRQLRICGSLSSEEAIARVEEHLRGGPPGAAHDLRRSAMRDYLTL